MRPYTYHAPTTVEEAVDLLARYGPRAKMLAGGTDILVQMRAGMFDLDAVVDVKRIPELNTLAYTPDDGLVVGAAVPCRKVYEDETVAGLYPGLIDAAALIGSIQIQGRASIGGNLCNAAPSGDTIPALIALEAACEIAGPDGRRRVPVEQFCLGPRRTVLQEGELLVRLRLPPPRARTGAAYLRFIPRNEMDIAVAGVGASVVLDADQCVQSARIALAAVGPTPIFAEEAAAALVGQEPTDAAFKAAGQAARAAARPISDMRGTAEQRLGLVAVLTERALRTATRRAMAGG
jgi:CO/xanthine dehydrogenase FAD-binding subunit